MIILPQSGLLNQNLIDNTLQNFISLSNVNIIVIALVIVGIIYEFLINEVSLPTYCIYGFDLVCS